MRGHNVFLTGGAGVGKSHTLRLIRRWLERVGREYALTASTGCAAAIIGATTFHSTLGIGLAVKGPAFYVHKILKEDKGRMLRLRKLETLIVDEIGMLDGQLFDKAGAVVSQVRTSHLERDGTLVHGGSPGPYGGAQLVVCGDFMQLPPVEVDDQEVGLPVQGVGGARFSQPPAHDSAPPERRRPVRRGARPHAARPLDARGLALPGG